MTILDPGLSFLYTETLAVITPRSVPTPHTVNRVYRVQQELSSFTKDGPGMGAAHLGTDRMEVQARKFYSQRNISTDN
ncbi:hypothetical protein PENFLA_c011G10864 [Penicillium flavigenum]|uniref:BAP29/BAP31 transmembrane domain-containing protein n=1 Tax=Penicillium flavigenum TaxID=254877 RepID=A0A1V6TBU6_9EURO|nr:hypothetical protein PENFLA_c011G10864 [Penicillium flavigenum]